MESLRCILLGYLLGCLNPAALLSKLKKINLRKHGTGNLGATNTMLVLGKGWGALVLFFDIGKSFAAVRLAQFCCPALPVAGLLGGCGAVLGHIFPFYMHFKGGKGLAALAGLVLAYDPCIFLTLLILGCTLMLIFNYGIALTFSAATLFPILAGLHAQSLTDFLIAFAICLLIILKHRSVLAKVRRGEDTKIRDYIKTKLFH